MIEQIRIPHVVRDVNSSRRIGSIKGDAERQPGKQKKSPPKPSQKSPVASEEAPQDSLIIADDEPLKGSKIDEVV